MSVKKETITKGILEVLQKSHIDKRLANKIFLACKFFMFQMDPFKMMEHHLNKLGVMANELDTIKATIPKEVKDDGYVDEPIKQLPNFDYFLEVVQS
jgi:hypothetical protein